MNELKGIILIDKPKGNTSPEITKKISEKLNTKSGHCGALDPYATGILPITLGKAVKIQEYLQKKDKEYRVEIETEKEVSKEKMKKTLESFEGKIKQIPPEKSAVKREERERNIYKTEYLEKKDKKHIFNVECQHGTYIRTLVKDLGGKLNTKTKLTSLRRTKIGEWTEEDTWEPEEINKLIGQGQIKKALIPIRDALKKLPEIKIKETALDSIKHGEDLKTPGIKNTSGKINKGKTVILTQKNTAIALGTAQRNKDELKEKGIAVKTEKVLTEI